MTGLRLLLYDDTCRGRRFRPGLTHAWSLGGRLYRLLGRFDARFGARSWEEGLTWLATHRPDLPLAEVQLWMHGRWGRGLIDGAPLTREALREEHPLHALLLQIRDRIAGPSALWWFRTCETFGAEEGRRFAEEWTRFFGCRAAGHTHVIGSWQSGLHLLEPGAPADWPPGEGLAEGSPEAPLRALGSRPWRTRTIFCLRGRVPRSW